MSDDADAMQAAYVKHCREQLQRFCDHMGLCIDDADLEDDEEPSSDFAAGWKAAKEHNHGR